MTASSTLVNTAEAAELRLFHHLGNHDATSPFVMNCESFIANSDAASLLDTVINYRPALDVLMKEDSDADEAVGAFSLLAALLDRVENKTLSGQIVLRLAGAVEDHDTGSAERKMNMLCALYNLRSGAKEKCWLIGRILTLCAFSGDEEMVLTLLPGRNSTLGNLLEENALERLMMGFSSDGADALDKADWRSLFNVASTVVNRVAEVCAGKDLDKEAIGAQSLKQRFLLKLLATYGNDAVDDDGLRAAREAAIGAIRDPVTLFNEQRSILSLLPIQQLAKNSGTSNLHSCLEIFQEGKLEDFQSFAKSHPSSLTECDISEETAIRHMRLLSLCSLATEHEEIPYDAIASTLQVDTSEVESWVINAVNSGLLTAKMDQLKHVVMVERCVVRKFGMEQWKILQERLNVWKKNVKGVLDGLEQSQVQ